MFVRPSPSTDTAAESGKHLVVVAYWAPLRSTSLIRRSRSELIDVLRPAGSAARKRKPQKLRGRHKPDRHSSDDAKIRLREEAVQAWAEPPTGRWPHSGNPGMMRIPFR